MFLFSPTVSSVTLRTSLLNKKTVHNLSVFLSLTHFHFAWYMRFLCLQLSFRLQMKLLGLRWEHGNLFHLSLDQNTAQRGQEREKLSFPLLGCCPSVDPGKEQMKMNHVCWWFGTLLT